MAELTREEEESNKVKEDWKFVAMVLDRWFIKNTKTQKNEQKHKQNKYKNQSEQDEKFVAMVVDRWFSRIGIMEYKIYESKIQKRQK